MMKKDIILVVFLFVFGLLNAQHIPLGINYQAIARDNAGNELKSTNLSIRISIISGSASGNAVYSETHSVTTDPFGLFTLTIGQGSFNTGTVEDFADIRWGESSHFLKVEANFGDGYIAMGTMPFLAVPYALYAANAGETDGEKDLDKDPTNELQVLSFDGTNLSISEGNTISLGNLLNDGDSDPENEIQDLKLEGHKFRLTKNADPTIIDLEPYLDNTDEQQLSVNKSNNQLSISGGNTVNIDTDTTNELQQITKSGYDISLSRNGGTVNIKPDIIAFRALKDFESTINEGEEVDLIFNVQQLDTGETPENEVGFYNEDNGVFTVPSQGEGLYQFSLTYDFDSRHSLRIRLNGELHEIIFEGYGLGVSGIKTYSFIMQLNAGDKVNFTLLNQSVSFCGRGTFYGYRIH